MKNRDISYGLLTQAFGNFGGFLGDLQKSDVWQETFNNAQMEGQQFTFVASPNQRKDYRILVTLLPDQTYYSQIEFLSYYTLSIGIFGMKDWLIGQVQDHIAQEFKPEKETRYKVDFQLPSTNLVEFSVSEESLDSTAKQAHFERRFDKGLASMAIRVVWMQKSAAWEDILAQAAWWLVKDGVYAPDVEEFLVGYAERWCGDDGPGHLFDKNYLGHLSPFSLKAYLQLVRRQNAPAGSRGITKIWPKTVPEVAEYIGVDVRTLYYAITRGAVRCESHAKARTRTAGQATYVLPFENRYLFSREQAEEAKAYFTEKKRRQSIIEFYAESRQVKASSARRWLERQEKANPNIDYKKVARQILDAMKKD